MKIKYSIFASLVILSMILTACAPAATPAPEPPKAEEPAAAEPTKAAEAPAAEPTKAAEAPAEGKKFNVFMMPKVTGNPYFEACFKGATEASNELGDINLIWQAPSKGDPNEQIELIQSAIAQKVDAILVSATDMEALVPVMKQAKDAGIFVATWDADVNKEGRTIFFNQASLEGIGRALAKSLGRILNYEGKYGIVSSTTTAPNQTKWIEWFNKELEENPDKYGKMEFTEIVYGGDMDEPAYQAAQGLLKAHPDLNGIMAPGSTMIAASARAIKDSGKTGQVLLTGLGVPSEMRSYVKDGTSPEFVLWNPIDLGYLSIYGTEAWLKGSIEGDGGEFKAGRLGDYKVTGDEVLLGEGFAYNKENVDSVDF